MAEQYTKSQQNPQAVYVSKFNRDFPQVMQPPYQNKKYKNSPDNRSYPSVLSKNTVEDGWEISFCFR